MRKRSSTFLKLSTLFVLVAILTLVGSRPAYSAYRYAEKADKSPIHEKLEWLELNEFSYPPNGSYVRNDIRINRSLLEDSREDNLPSNTPEPSRDCPDGWEPLHKSICFTQKVIEGPNQMHVTRVDLEDPAVDVSVLPTSEIGNISPVSRASKNKGAVVSINASFFHGNGLPIGVFANDGQWLYKEKDMVQVLSLYNDGSSKINFIDSFMAQKDPLKHTRMVVSGSHILVLNGEAGKNLGPDNSAGLVYGNQPRTAIGVSGDGFLYMVVNDGRSSASAGLSMPRLAQFMAELGSVNAINLDGGGSSVKAVRGNVVSVPSDGAERPVATMVSVTLN